MEDKQKNYCFLGFDNILSEQEIENLFTPEEEDGENNAPETSENERQEPEEKVEPQGQKKDNTAETVAPEDLFDEVEDNKSESVGSEKKKALRSRKMPPLKKAVVLLQTTSTLPLPMPWQWMVSSPTLQKRPSRKRMTQTAFPS